MVNPRGQPGVVLALGERVGQVGPQWRLALTAGAVSSFKLALRDIGVIRHTTTSNPLLALDAEATRVRDIMARVGIQSPLTRA
jgi:dihydrodipicolinate synthase/N-acetylneuraminate lyase